MDKLLSIEPGMLIWTFITFALLLWILKMVAWKPLLKMLGGREQRIASDLDRADEARREAERLLAGHRVLMENSERDARKLIDEAKTTGETMKQSIIDNANEQSRQMIAQARTEIQREKDSAIMQLKSEVSDLAVRAAEKILGAELDAVRHKKIVDDFISRLPHN